jgi:hypothetical protein
MCVLQVFVSVILGASLGARGYLAALRGTMRCKTYEDLDVRILSTLQLTKN